MLTSKPNAKVSLEESLNVVPNETGTPQYVHHAYGYGPVSTSY
jgi:exosome complex exonuclease RRP6